MHSTLCQVPNNSMLGLIGFCTVERSAGSRYILWAAVLLDHAITSIQDAEHATLSIKPHSKLSEWSAETAIMMQE